MAAKTWLLKDLPSLDTGLQVSVSDNLENDFATECHRLLLPILPLETGPLMPLNVDQKADSRKPNSEN